MFDSQDTLSDAIITTDYMKYPNLKRQCGDARQRTLTYFKTCEDELRVFNGLPRNNFGFVKHKLIRRFDKYFTG